MDKLLEDLDLLIEEWSRGKPVNSDSLRKSIIRLIDNADEDDMLTDILVRKYNSLKDKHPDYDDTDIELEVLNSVRGSLLFIM